MRKRALKAVLIALLQGVSGGCATVYVTALRSEYVCTGASDGVYLGRREYPRAYPATWVSAVREVPAWCSLDGGVTLWWVLSAGFSVLDLGVSAMTDTVCLPFDGLMVLHAGMQGGEEDGGHDEDDGL